jgi:hypothetical protein
VLTTPAHAILAARRGERPLAAALAAGTVTMTGSKRALRNFQRVFDLR